MADSWYDNAWNQLPTLKALRDACNTSGFFGYTTLPADTREVCTIGDLNTYVITYKGNDPDINWLNIYDTYTSPNNNECFTCGEINMAQFFYVTPQTTTCSFTGSEQLLYSSGTSSLFAVGCQLYTNRARTTTKTFSTQGWIYSFGTSYEVSTAGVILSIYSC